MRQAIQIAHSNIITQSGWPVACVIAKDDKIVFTSTNKMSPWSFDPTAHAEITTIREFCTKEKIWQCSWYDLYVTSEPCPMCLWAIYRACFDRVFYCNTIEDAEDLHRIDKKIYRELSLPRTQRCIPCIHIHDSAGTDLLTKRRNRESTREDLQGLIAMQRSKVT